MLINDPQSYKFYHKSNDNRLIFEPFPSEIKDNFNKMINRNNLYMINIKFDRENSSDHSNINYSFIKYDDTHIPAKNDNSIPIENNRSISIENDNDNNITNVNVDDDVSIENDNDNDNDSDNNITNANANDDISIESENDITNFNEEDNILEFNCVKCSICKKLIENIDDAFCIANDMYLCRRDFVNYQKNKTLPKDFLDEYCYKIIEDTFNPFIFKENIDEYQEEDFYLTDDIINKSYHLNKNYEYFLPTITIHFKESPEELDFKQIIEIFSKERIIWIEKGSTFLKIAFIASNLYELKEEFQTFKLKISSALGKSIIGNFDFRDVNIPNEEDIKNFYIKQSFNLLQNTKFLDQIDFEQIKKVVIEKLSNQRIQNDSISFIFEHVDLFIESEKKIRQDIYNNSIEFIIVGETIIANKYFQDYELIKNSLILDNFKYTELFLYHGSLLRNHPKIISDHFILPNENGYIEANDPGYFGKGIYATDNIFYASMYSNGGKQLLNFDEKVSVICCRAIYNEDKSKKIEYSKKKFEPIELTDDTIALNGVNKAFVGSSKRFCVIPPEQTDEIVANEYIFGNKYQIIPISSFTIMRTSHFILWIDTVTASYEIPEHNKILKEMEDTINVNIYYVKTKEEAISLMKTKKVNNMKLILSVPNKELCESLIDEANKILNYKFVSLIYIKDNNFKDISKNKINVLYTDKKEHLIEFAQMKLNYDKIDSFIKSINHNKINPNIDVRRLKKVFPEITNENDST